MSTYRRETISVILIGAIVVLGLLAGQALTQEKKPFNWPMLERITPDPRIAGDFAAKKAKDDPASDLSGIACRPPLTDGVLDCLVINDENKAAQRVRIADRTLTPDKRPVPLIGDNLPRDALGAEPKVKSCPGGKGDFKDLDGEGVAFAPGPAESADAFLVVGSHGCARNADEYRPSSFLLARVPIAQDGALGSAQLTWRLSDALRAADQVKDTFGTSLKKADGLNIEGIAVVGDRLLVGLRAPSHKGNAFIVGTSVKTLFAAEDITLAASPTVFALPVGEHAGIRDMTALEDGQLLVLIGPAQEQPEVPFGIILVSLPQTGDQASFTPLGLLEDVNSGGERAKAEAITVLGKDKDALRVLILFDGIQNGGPREYRIRIPR